MSKVAPPKPLHHAVIAERAQGFRRAPTVEEAALWRVLRGRRLGVRFVRQLVIGPYIVDFAAPEVRLVVVVDGGCHERRKAADARRDEKLRRWGWRVVRVGAREVMGDLESVVGRVERNLR